MIEIRKSTNEDIEKLMDVRLEMLRVVNNLGAEKKFSQTLIDCSREYFLHGDQTTVLAEDFNDGWGGGECDGKAIGCASISYITIMPTFSHPTGKRAHLMNVYVNKAYRRQGIARKMVSALIAEARSRGCTEISLDATSDGEPLYESLGFVKNNEGMCMNLS